MIDIYQYRIGTHGDLYIGEFKDEMDCLKKLKIDELLGLDLTEEPLHTDHFDDNFIGEWEGKKLHVFRRLRNGS